MERAEGEIVCLKKGGEGSLVVGELNRREFNFKGRVKGEGIGTHRGVE